MAQTGGPVIAFAICGTIVLALMTLADSITDKRKEAKIYPRWHKRFRRFRPHWLWRKLQNRWHLWKQLRYLLPAVYIWSVVVYSVWVLLGWIAAVLVGIGLVIMAWCLWRVVEKPIWWD